MGKLLVVGVALVVAALVMGGTGVSAQTKYTVRAKTMQTAKLVTNLLPPPPPLRDDEEDGLPLDQDAELVDALPKPKPAAAAKKAAKKAEKAAKKAVAAAKKAAKKAQKAAAKAAALSTKASKAAKKAEDKKAVKKAEKKAEKKAAAKKEKKEKKELKAAAKKAKLQPGEASKRAAAAVKAAKKEAPKDQLMRWIRENSPDASEAELQKIGLYLKGQLIHTFEDLLSRGEEGIKALLVGDKWREKFMDLLINHIGKTRGVDDGMLVPSPPLKKGYNPRFPPEKKQCKHGDLRQPVPPPTGNAARFLAVSVNAAAPSPVGDWLRRAFPDVKPLRMSRTILALERQAIRSFEDLRRVGTEGVKRLLYVPEGIREALHDAIIYSIGTEGHDDGKPVTAVRYVPPKPVKESCN